MSTTTKIITAVAFCCIAIAATAGILLASDDQSTGRKTVAAHVSRVVVDADAASVDVTANGGAAVSYAQTTHVLFSGAKVEQAVRGDTLYLDSNCTDWFLCSNDIDLEVPAGTTLAIATEAGDIHVHGTPGSLALVSDAGDVTADLSVAPLRIGAETDAGNVRVSVPRGRYTVAAHAEHDDVGVTGITHDVASGRTIEAASEAGEVELLGR